MEEAAEELDAGNILASIAFAASLRGGGWFGSGAVQECEAGARCL